MNQYDKLLKEYKNLPLERLLELKQQIDNERYVLTKKANILAIAIGDKNEEKRRVLQEDIR